jgi:multiple sugar transport system ATP-binding protein
VQLDPQGTQLTVTLCELLGEDVIIDLDLGGQTLRTKTAARNRVTEGARIGIRIDADRLHLFDAATGDRLAD